MNAIERVVSLTGTVDRVGQIYSYTDILNHIDKVTTSHSKRMLREKGYRTELDIVRQYIECPDGFRIPLFDDNVEACLCYYKWSLKRVSYTFSEAADLQISHEIDWKHLPFDSFFISTQDDGFIVNRLRSFTGRNMIQIVDYSKTPVSTVYQTEEVPERVKCYVSRLQEISRKQVTRHTEPVCRSESYRSASVACRTEHDGLSTTTIRVRSFLPSAPVRTSAVSYGTGSPKSPHVRRGHYQRFWKGSGDEKKQITRWIKPVMIHAEAGYVLPCAVAVM